MLAEYGMKEIMNKRYNEKQRGLVEIICNDIEEILFIKNKDTFNGQLVPLKSILSTSKFSKTNNLKKDFHRLNNLIATKSPKGMPIIVPIIFPKDLACGFVIFSLFFLLLYIRQDVQKWR